MNKLILCEGATDAILLSYYLERTARWKFTRKTPQGLSIRATEQNEEVTWYQKNGDCLLICAVGGKDNFGKFFDDKIQKPLVMTDAFEKIAIVTDRDNREIRAIETQAAAFLKVPCGTIRNNQWNDCRYTNEFGMEKSFSALLVVIPQEQEGALETAMLAAIAEDPYDKSIVEQTGAFAAQMRQEASRYIPTDRLKLKAHLGLTWAVQYPEKVFSRIDEQIRNVKWEESETLRSCFAALTEI